MSTMLADNVGTPDTRVDMSVDKKESQNNDRQCRPTISVRVALP